MELVTFVLARIGEDESEAREASVMPYGDQIGWVGHVFSSERHSTRAQDAHIARWDPARVLAECAAKRRIVEADARRWTLRKDAPNGLGYGSHPTGLIRVRLDDSSELMTLDEFNRRYCERAEPSEHVRLLALPYRDHHDYDARWNPEATQ